MCISVIPSSWRGPRRPIRSAMAVLLVAASSVVAQPTMLSLDDARGAASAAAPGVAAKSARIVAAREDAARAAALPDPTLNLGIDNLTVTGPEASVSITSVIGFIALARRGGRVRHHHAAVPASGVAAPA